MTLPVPEGPAARRKAVRMVLCIGAALSCAVPVAAQRPAGNQGDTWADIATLPNWSGAWVVPFDDRRFADALGVNHVAPPAQPPAMNDTVTRRVASRNRGIVMMRSFLEIADC